MTSRVFLLHFCANRRWAEMFQTTKTQIAKVLPEAGFCLRLTGMTLRTQVQKGKHEMYIERLAEQLAAVRRKQALSGKATIASILIAAQASNSSLDSQISE